MNTRTSAQDSVVMSWTAYLRHHMGVRSQATFADAANVKPSTLSRWLAGKQLPDAPTAIDLARAINDEPLNALVAAGFITAEEAGQQPAAAPHLGGLSDDELLAEIAARLKRETVMEHEQPRSPSIDAAATGTPPEAAGAGRSGDGHDAGPPPPSSSDASGDDIPVVRRARRKQPRTDTTSRRDTPHGTS